jgi:hypothetical protein
MASQDSSFNALGPTVVAFETIDNGPRSFGVGVQGSQVGVHGEGMASPLGSRAVSVQAVGVHGRGDSYGVYGVVGTINSADAPDPASLSDPHGVIGVVGVSNTGPGVLGDNGVLQPAISAGTLRDDMITITSAKVGVVGVSVSAGETEDGGGGVVGVAGIDTASGHEALTYVGSPPRVESNGLIGFNSGVTAVGAGPGPGLYAVASGGRAGIFESLPSPAHDGFVAAQVQLVPLKVDFYQGAEFTPVQTPLVSLPILGQLGDLISVVFSPVPQRSAASLWFCIHSGTDTQNPAQWAEISFGRGVIGTRPPS